MATTPAAAEAAAAAGGAAILDTLGDFTSRENWDKFFALRGTGDSFEWYAEWDDLRAPLLSLLHGGGGAEGGGKAPEILVPGCGSSVLSERLYDAGFRRVTNVDFSRVLVADMLRRHARARPEMRWRVMDMTDMQVRPRPPVRFIRFGVFVGCFGARIFVVLLRCVWGRIYTELRLCLELILYWTTQLGISHRIEDKSAPTIFGTRCL
jgi:hypothetical protein